MSDLKPALVRLLRAAFPHSDFPDGPYERVADKIIARSKKTSTTSSSSSRVSRPWSKPDWTATQDDEVAEKLLQELANTEFFTFIRGIAVVSLYDDHEVWELLGYEGASFDKGGYIDRGFDDLDWLPTTQDRGVRRTGRVRRGRRSRPARERLRSSIMSDYENACSSATRSTMTPRRSSSSAPAPAAAPSPTS